MELTIIQKPIDSATMEYTWRVSEPCVWFYYRLNGVDTGAYVPAQSFEYTARIAASDEIISFWAVDANGISTSQSGYINNTTMPSVPSSTTSFIPEIRSVPDVYIDASNPQLSPSVAIQKSVWLGNVIYGQDVENLVYDVNLLIDGASYVGWYAQTAAAFPSSFAISANDASTILQLMSSVKQRTATLRIVAAIPNTTGAGYGYDIIGSVEHSVTLRTSAEDSSPTFPGFTYSDSNSATVAITGDDQLLVQLQSTLRVICSAATAKNGASISRYTAKINGVEKSAASTTINFGTVSGSGSLMLLVTATDSRGYTASVTKTITVLSYQQISFDTYAIRRENNVGSTTQLLFTGSVSPVIINDNARNALQSVQYRYKTASGTYGDWTDLSGVTSGTYGFSFSDDAWLVLSENNAYTVQIKAADKLTTATITLTLPSAKPLVSFRAEKVGINTNNPQSTLDVNGNIHMNGFGILGYLGELDDNQNLDDCTAAGIWSRVSANPSTSKNYPAAVKGWLEVICSNDGWILQRYTTWVGYVYIRGNNSVSWTSWAKHSPH